MSFASSAKCVLVIGATAGIGRELALAIHELPSRPTVIVAGRRQARLDEIVSKGSKAGKENLYGLQVDLTSDVKVLEQFVKDTLDKFPQLDAVIFSAAVQHVIEFKKSESFSLDALQDEFRTNYISVLTLTKYFLPHFLRLADTGNPSFLIAITSGLGYVPVAVVPGYSATKAAVHSLWISLRAQLRDTRVNVIEITPPLVESELHDHQGRTPLLSKHWMTLNEFTPQVIQGLERGDKEIPIGTAVGAHGRWENGKQEVADRLYQQATSMELQWGRINYQ